MHAAAKAELWTKAAYRLSTKPYSNLLQEKQNKTNKQNKQTKAKTKRDIPNKIYLPRIIMF